MSASMLGLLRDRVPVDVFDRAPAVGSFTKTLLQQAVRIAEFSLQSFRLRRSVVYLALSGGMGQAVDACYLLVARVLRRPIFVHHHSFAYIDSSPILSRCIFALARHAHHIVLSDGMGKAMRARYKLDSDKILVLSNAAFFESEMIDHPHHGDPSVIRIGFLSNITVEKGFVEFFEIASRLRQRGIAIDPRIAGPVAAEARARFDDLLRAVPEVRYVGPLYDEAKAAFFRNLDVFIFPTHYRNEAEPLVLHEALRAGAYPIATSRGAIAEVLADGAGLAFAEGEIVERAVDHISAFSRDPGNLKSARLNSIRRAKDVRAKAIARLSDILDLLTPKYVG